mmetsp:Transcript_7252/g.32000  ORF Transcript_7252/g.32000 Transcript_7252/m.32000 type:complete len:204 (-) Transcript_7252:1886-2497(-)
MALVNWTALWSSCCASPALSSRTSMSRFSHVLAWFWAVAAPCVYASKSLWSSVCLAMKLPSAHISSSLFNSSSPSLSASCAVSSASSALHISSSSGATSSFASASMRSSSSTLYCVGPMLSCCCCLASERSTFVRLTSAPAACLLFVRSPTAFWILCLASEAAFLSALSCFSSLFFSLSSTLIDLARSASFATSRALFIDFMG